MNIVREIEIKKGRRLYGHVVELDDGQKLYLARRSHAQIFRAGKASISEAMSVEEASWAIDEITLYNMRAKGIKVIGVRVHDTGDLYLTHISNFFDLKRAKVKDYEARGGARQRYLPLQYFAFKRGATVLAGVSSTE